MLSKSQARIFFLVFTIGFSLVFLGLTVDTIRQVPARTDAAGLTPLVVRGKEIWEQKNCMGCHTILGEGAYYAPELTKVVDRRGEPWLKIFLRDPAAMFPGERKMVKYDFSDDDIDAVIAFLAWVGRIDTNGFPRKPDLAPASSSAPTPSDSSTTSTTSTTSATSTAATLDRAPPAMFTQVCQACHALRGRGGNVGPALDGVGTRFERASLDRWLQDPQAVKPGTAMPNLHLDDATRAVLVNWLLSLR